MNRGKVDSISKKKYAYVVWIPYWFSIDDGKILKWDDIGEAMLELQQHVHVKMGRPRILGYIHIRHVFRIHAFGVRFVFYNNVSRLRKLRKNK